MDTQFMSDGSGIALEEKPENIFAGIIGAFLFALAGGIVWFLLYLLGFLAGISGFVGVVCAIKGYALFAKKETKKGIVIAIIMAVLVMVVAWYFTFGYDIFQAYKEWYAAGEIDYEITFAQAMSAVPAYLVDPEIGISYIINLLLGLVLCAVGSVGYIISATKKLKQPAPVAPASPYYSEQQTNPYYNSTAPSVSSDTERTDSHKDDKN